jgi:teichuronic acid biosynthesis glycosyltransferase TuaG
MKNFSFIDIILPTYNSREFIYRSVSSVFNQTYKYWRLIIIDDASTDGTKEILEKLRRKRKNRKKIIILNNRINKGQGFSRNLGLKYAKSKFIAFLDSDDYWDKNKLKKQINYMQNNNYNFTYSDYKSFKGNITKKIIVPDFFDYKSFISNTSIATSTLMVERKILKNILFPSLRLCEDYYFKSQMLRKFNAYKCKGIYSFYRLRNNSLQSNRIKVLYAIWSINKNFNKMKFLSNLMSIFLISYNSLKKYGFR